MLQDGLPPCTWDGDEIMQRYRQQVNGNRHRLFLCTSPRWHATAKSRARLVGMNAFRLTVSVLSPVVLGSQAVAQVKTP
jgi:hypothetical protein